MSTDKNIQLEMKRAYDALVYVLNGYNNIEKINTNSNIIVGNEIYTKKKIILITQYFTSDNDMMQSNILFALSNNLKLEYIDIILLFTDKIYNFTQLQNSDKIRQISIGKRLTFQIAFDIANKRYSNNIIIIANSDIYFDETIQNVINTNFTQKVLALSKWKYNNDLITFYPRTDSQDAWIFQSPLPISIIPLTNFFLGTPRCDNRLAYIFHQLGYLIRNPIFRIHAIEIDSNIKREILYGFENAVFGPIKQVLLSAEI